VSAGWAVAIFANSEPTISRIGMEYFITIDSRIFASFNFVETNNTTKAGSRQNGVKML